MHLPVSTRQTFKLECGPFMRRCLRKIGDGSRCWKRNGWGTEALPILLACWVVRPGQLNAPEMNSRDFLTIPWQVVFELPAAVEK